jgi:dolichyl-phosphate-mannose-protein mannosyltransferase
VSRAHPLPELGGPHWRAISDLIPGLLFAAALALYSIRLAVPNQYIYDEVYHAYTAAEYVRGNPDAYVWDTSAPRPDVAYMWNHPPVGVLMIAGGITLWGNNSFGWRFSSAVFGAAGISLAFALALSLTRRRAIALLASSLLLLDGLYFVQSRTGMLDIFGTVFMIAALLAFYRHLTAEESRAEERWLLVTGLLLGLAIATKWNAAYPAVCIGVIALTRTLTGVGRASKGRVGRPGRALGLLAFSLGVVPAAVYLLAYTPFFLTGHTPSQFVELQRQILYYHSHLRARHPYESSWWQWPLALRPVWYYVAYMQDRIANIYANSNPVLSAAFVPAAAAVAGAWWKERRAGSLILLVGFFGQWLPWALVPRISFAYHFLPATPFGCIALAVALGWLWKRGPAGRAICVAYGGLVAGAFVFFFPIYASIPLTRHALDLRMWIPSWR